MTTQQEQETVAVQQLNKLLSIAQKKLGLKRENDICRFLPSPGGGYIHHFTMRKMKHQLPQKLSEMITKFIIDADAPISVKPKQRAPRGSRQRKELMSLSRSDIQRMLQFAVAANDKELVRKLMPKRELKALKRELIASIKKDTVDRDLWSCYCDAIEQAGAASNED